MTEICLNAAHWHDKDDFYNALLPALGAPPWHGHNLDALNDTIGGDDINDVKLPFHIRIVNIAALPPEMLAVLKEIDEPITDLRNRHGKEVSVTFLSHGPMHL
jgi:RNAse (barnase) inhibitor barstar